MSYAFTLFIMIFAYQMLPVAKLFLIVLITFHALPLLATEQYSTNFTTLTKQIANLSDKQKIKILDSLAKNFTSNEVEKALQFQDFCIKYINTNNIDKDNCAMFYIRKGQQYRKLRKFGLALGELLKAEEILLRKNNIAGLQLVNMSYANLYQQANQNIKAIKYALKAKDYAVQLENDESIGIAYNTLANLYDASGNIDSALIYFRKSIELLNLQGDGSNAALVLDNISLAYFKRNNIDSANFYNSKALNFAIRTKNPFLELQLLPSACGVAEKQLNYELQLKHALRSVFLADSLKQEVYKAYSLLNLASAYININQPNKALPMLKSNLITILEYGDYDAANTICFELSRAYELSGLPDSSLKYFKLHTQYIDSIEASREKDKVNELIASYQINQKEEKINHLNELNKNITEKNNLKSMVIWGAAVLIVIIIILLILTFRRFVINKKLNLLLTEKNNLIVEKSQALQIKNTEITDSINYARKIQSALLSDVNELTKYHQQNFIFFRPKDIVSGDFYWFTYKEDKLFIAAVDCTGHGVPGGFMSMLGHGFLNEIVIGTSIVSPAEILNQLRIKVITALKQTGTVGENKDGMDITLVVLNTKNNTVKYAAANNAPVLIRNNNILEFSCDKMPIGFSTKFESFKEHEIKIEKNDFLVLFTDGYADQFGLNNKIKSNADSILNNATTNDTDKNYVLNVLKNGKKFKHKNLFSLFNQISNLIPDEQKKLLVETFDEYKSGFTQTDDVCVIGIKF